MWGLLVRAEIYQVEKLHCCCNSMLWTEQSLQINKLLRSSCLENLSSVSDVHAFSIFSGLTLHVQENLLPKFLGIGGIMLDLFRNFGLITDCMEIRFLSGW